MMLVAALFMLECIPLAAVVGVEPPAALEPTPPAALEPAPSAEQLAWQNMEYGMFCHFGVNTFQDKEWGDGTEDPNLFQPEALDASQWVSTARAAGMKYLIITAKHHDGFCLFPSAYTEHSVASSSWRSGGGDVVKEVADACHKQGVRFGFYLSPWDRHEAAYDEPAVYDQHFKNQLREILTRYAPVCEVWFDGAGSEGHTYDWSGYYALIRELQPKALIAICGPDIRWVGNEDGLAPETLWNVQERNGEKVWWPAECDVPIRKGHWFYHTASEDRIRSLDEMLDIYYRSVGHGAVLLLNVTPDRRGVLPEADTARLRELWEVISKTFAVNLVEGKAVSASNVRGNAAAFGGEKMLDGNDLTYWATDDGVTEGFVEIDLGGPATFDRAMVKECIALGQRVEEHAIQVKEAGDWKEIAAGTTIGHKRLYRFEPVTASAVRLVVRKARACPAVSGFGLYKAPER